MNRLFEVADTYEAQQKELLAQSIEAAASIMPVEKIKDIQDRCFALITQYPGYNPMQQYENVYKRWSIAKDPLIKDLLLEKLQQVFQQIQNIHVDMLKLILIENDDVPFDTLLRDLDRIRAYVPLWHEKHEWSVCSVLHKIKDIWAKQASVLTPIDPLDDAFTMENFASNNEELAEHIKAYNEACAKIKTCKVPNAQLRADPGEEDRLFD